MDSLNFVFLGLSITSSWGNGHATTYRALVRELAARGHRVLFLERDAPWYRDNADLPSPPFCRTVVYRSLEELTTELAGPIADADVVVLGSYVPDGSEIASFLARTARGITAFYDIDTPVTLRALARDECKYLARQDVPLFDLYLSFTGGPTLRRIEADLGAKRALPLYCSVDPALYYPESHAGNWELGYLGTYSDDRQPVLERLLLEPARIMGDRRFIVAGSMYPSSIVFPENVDRREHVPPTLHRFFYSSQRWTLNVTRSDMIAAGWSPSVRLFEAAACGVPIISDAWAGLDAFFAPGEEIVLASDPDDVVRILRDVPDARRREIGASARARVLAEHTAAHRAATLEGYVTQAIAERGGRPSRGAPNGKAGPGRPAPRFRSEVKDEIL